jgi:hypothetical protein
VSLAELRVGETGHKAEAHLKSRSGPWCVGRGLQPVAPQNIWHAAAALSPFLGSLRSVRVRRVSLVAILVVDPPAHATMQEPSSLATNASDRLERFTCP